MSVLKVSDAFCYICRGVLIEPVTVPCFHVFCYTCFEQSMQETSYSCPLCRRRISNWVRTAKKSDKLINVELWTKIQEQFKEQVYLKLRGEDDGLDEKLKEESPTPVSLSKPGEVAEEFSKLISEFETERERLKYEEEIASSDLIKKLTEEEELELEALRKNNLLKIKQDHELAMKLQAEIVSELPTSSQKQRKNQKERISLPKGPMDSFLKGNSEIRKRNGLRLFSQDKVKARSTSSDSTDSIQSEMHHFKPIKVVPRTPPKRYPDGKILEIPVTKVKPLKLLNYQNGMNAHASGKNLTEIKKIHSPYSAFIGKTSSCRVVDTNESPRKRLRTTADEPDSGVLKEITLGENSDSNSMTDNDLKIPQSDSVKKKRNSPGIVSKSLKKPLQNNTLLSPKLYHFDSAEENSAAENENSDIPQLKPPGSPPLPQFDTQDYLRPESDIEEKLIEEQRRIEQLILQEKADRELALKLSQEWERRYELRKKPMKQKQTAEKRKKRGHENKKLQPTLIDTLVKTRSRNK